MLPFTLTASSLFYVRVFDALFAPSAEMSIKKFFSRIFNAVFAPTGKANKTSFKELAAYTSPSGQLRKRTARVVTGVQTFVSSLHIFSTVHRLIFSGFQDLVTQFVVRGRRRGKGRVHDHDLIVTHHSYDHDLIVTHHSYDHDYLQSDIAHVKDVVIT